VKGEKKVMLNLMRGRALNRIFYHTITITPTVDRNKHGDAALQSGAGSVLTTSGPQAYHGQSSENDT
jgi:hypothetical protein